MSRPDIFPRRVPMLSLENTVLQEAYSAAPGFMSEEAIRTVLGAFLFTGDDGDKLVKVLSGGEKSRLILAKLLINPPNFLLLDEPTTHLDVEAVEALVRALNTFEGSIVFISHDVYFVQSVANNVFEVKNGQIRKFPGTFDYYLEKKDQVRETNVGTGFKPVPTKKHGPDETSREKAREEEKKRREEEKKRKVHNAAVRDKINKVVKQKETLQLESYAKARALSNPHIFRDEDTARAYGRRLKEIEKEIGEINLKIKEFEGGIQHE
jgi:ATP-binding cassette subfamily F protein 3